LARKTVVAVEEVRPVDDAAVREIEPEVERQPIWIEGEPVERASNEVALLFWVASEPRQSDGCVRRPVPEGADRVGQVV